MSTVDNKYASQRITSRHHVFLNATVNIVSANALWDCKVFFCVSEPEQRYNRSNFSIFNSK